MDSEAFRTAQLLSAKGAEADWVNLNTGIDFAPTGRTNETQRAHGGLPKLTNLQSAAQTVADVVTVALPSRGERHDFTVRNRTKFQPPNWFVSHVFGAVPYMHP